MTIRSLLVTGATIATVCLAACASTHDEANCPDPKPGTIVSVNDYCAVMPEDPVDPELTREWKGQKVGFCCKGCLPEWDKKTEGEKDAALAAAVAKGKLKS